jgi:hypothetical protein
MSVSGGLGWLDVGIGMQCRLSDNFSLTPALGLMANFVIGDESFANTIILPKLVARFQFDSIPTAYIAGELNYNIPNSGSDRFDLESGGIGYAGTIGYIFEGGWRLEAGYSYIQVDAEPSGGRGMGGREDNLGGIVLRFGTNF